MTEIRLLTQNPDYTKLPSGQADTYRLLLELGEGSYSLKDIIRRCNFRSPLPFWARLRHLETRGLIRMTNPAELPASTVKV
jgi:hypothetical protein